MLFCSGTGYSTVLQWNWLDCCSAVELVILLYCNGTSQNALLQWNWLESSSTVELLERLSVK